MTIVAIQACKEYKNGIQNGAYWWQNSFVQFDKLDTLANIPIGTSLGLRLSHDGRLFAIPTTTTAFKVLCCPFTVYAAF
jgi:hypothetical protein